MLNNGISGNFIYLRIPHYSKDLQLASLYLLLQSFPFLFSEDAEITILPDFNPIFVDFYNRAAGLTPAKTYYFHFVYIIRIVINKWI